MREKGIIKAYPQPIAVGRLVEFAVEHNTKGLQAVDVVLI